LHATPDTFDPDAFDRLALDEPGHFWFEERRRLIAWAVERYFPAAQSFCDIGCGTGFVLEGLARAQPHLKLTGIDPYLQGLAHAAKRLPGVDLRQGDVLAASSLGPFDVVGCFDVLEHIPDDQRAVKELAGALRPGGGLILTVPQHPRLWSAADEIGHHQRRYTRAGLLDRLEAGGMVCRRVTSFVSFLLPVLLARRRAGLTRNAALAELHPSGSANMLGSLLLRLERVLIGKGVSFPFGGSLLVVATKAPLREQPASSEG
jgi:SAM-dependent methyltransferase